MLGRYLRSLAPLLLLLVASPLAAALPAQPLSRLKAMQQQILMREPAERAEQLERRLKEWRKKSARSAGRTAGLRRRPEVEGELVPVRTVGYSSRAPRAALRAITAPPNRLMNDTIAEPDGACQSEISIASYGNYVVAAWNDGIGIYNGTDTQGFAYSVDDGLN